MCLGKAGFCLGPSPWGLRPGQLFRLLQRVCGPEGGGGARFSEVFLGAQDLTSFLLLFPCAVGRNQFMRFEGANHAAEALGCEYEELNTATFKHHLRQIIEQVTAGPSRRGPEDEETSSGTAWLPFRVGWVPTWGDTRAPLLLSIGDLLTVHYMQTFSSSGHGSYLYGACGHIVSSVQ